MSGIFMMVVDTWPLITANVPPFRVFLSERNLGETTNTLIERAPWSFYSATARMITDLLRFLKFTTLRFKLMQWIPVG